MEAYIKLLKEQNPEMTKYFELMQPMMEQKEIEVEAIVENSKVDPELENQINKRVINKPQKVLLTGIY
mgnify:CR=1 FL=1